MIDLFESMTIPRLHPSAVHFMHSADYKPLFLRLSTLRVAIMKALCS